MGAQEDYAETSSFAERLGIPEDQRDDWITDAMSRLGHVAKTIWEDATPDPATGGGGGNPPSGVLSLGTRQPRQQPERRNVGGRGEYGG